MFGFGFFILTFDYGVHLQVMIVSQRFEKLIVDVKSKIVEQEVRIIFQISISLDVIIYLLPMLQNICPILILYIKCYLYVMYIGCIRVIHVLYVSIIMFVYAMCI
jgi:hypothetical protein